VYTGLMEIKGIGERVAKGLVEHYGSESEVLSSFARYEFERLLSAPIPGHKAVEIARELYAQKHGFEYSDLLKTPEAKELYSEVLDIVKGYANTEYSRLMLNVLFPTKDGGEIARRMEDMESAKKRVEALGREKVDDIRRLLKGTGPLNPERRWKGSSVVAVEDRGLYEELSGNYKGLVDFIFIDSIDEASSLKDYDFVRYLRSSSDRFWEAVAGLRHVEEVFEREEEKAVPEVVLSFYASNRGQILAALRIAELVPELSEKVPEGLAELVARVGEGEMSRDCDERLEKAALASERLPEVAYECLKLADETIRARVEEGGVAIGGREVLEILEKVDFSDPARIYDYLPPEFVDILKGESERWEIEIAKRLGIDDEMLFVGLFSERLHYPLEIAEERLEDIQRTLRVKRRRVEYGVMKELAGSLAAHLDIVKELVRDVLELDVELALGLFALEFEIAAPEISDDLGIALRGAKHVVLCREALKGGPEIQAVSYAVGDAGAAFEGSNGERITVLTGANSGGKTTLLETLAQAQIMAQCGLGVCAKEARIALLDGVHLFARRKGAGDAGAFEALLREFERVSTLAAGERSLILADEIEAVTEPGAAAEIISALMEWFLKEESVLMVVVSHLGEELSKSAPEGVRMDGIDATGLDPELQLIVDRNPVLDRLARSTPELIVERLSRSKGKGSAFYTHILTRFE